MRKFKKFAVLTFLIFLVSGFSQMFAQGPGPAWEFSRYITLSATTPLDSFQIKITLNGATQHSHINADGSDLRFYDITGTTAFNYWIEKWNPSGTSVVWVKVPTSGTGSLKMYYGNTSASSLSNGYNVFDFFDGFEGAALKPNWTSIETGGTITMNGNEVVLNNTGDKVSISTEFIPKSNDYFIEVKHKETGYFRTKYYVTNDINSNLPPGVEYDYGYWGTQYGVPETYGNIIWGEDRSTGKAVTANSDVLTQWKNVAPDPDGPYTFQWTTINFADYQPVYSASAYIYAPLSFLIISLTDNSNSSTLVDCARVRKSSGTTEITTTLGPEISSFPLPTVTSVSPSPVCEGVEFTINGSFLTNYEISVTVGGVPLTVNSHTNSSISAVAGSNGGAVVVTTAKGSSTESVTLIVNPLPVVSAGAVLSDICQGEISSVLNGSVTGGSSTGTWTSDAAGTFSPNASDLNASWTPPASFSGTATLTLTSTNACGTRSDSKQLIVNPLPTGTISVSPSSVCAGDPITFTALLGYYTYSFLVNGVSVQNGNSNTFAPKNLKTADVVKVLIKTTKGCSVTFDVPAFTVNDYPTGTLSAFESSGVDNDKIICAGDLVSFGFDNVSYTNYKFILNGTTVLSDGSEAFTGTNSFPNGGSLTLEVTGPGGCVKTFGPIIITVNDLPVGILTAKEGAAISDNIICSGENVEFSATQGFLNYEFQVNGSRVLNGSSTVFNTTGLSNTDEVTVIVTNVNGCAATLGPIKFVVNDLPQVPTISHSTPITFCSGESVILNSTSANSYQWNLNGTAISGAISASYEANSTGNYSVTISNSNGCIATSSAISVVVNALPGVPVISTSGATEFCAGEDVTLSSTMAGSYQWYRNGIIIVGETGQTYLASISGDYTVEVKNVNGCPNISQPTVVKVNPLPSAPVITPGGSTSFCEGENVLLSSSSATTYQWYKNGVEIPLAINQTYLANSQGDYTVKIADGNSCYATSAVTNIIVHSLPMPTLTGPGTICPNSTGVYTTDPGGSNYTWTIVGGTPTGPTGEQSITVNWGADGVSKSILVNYENQWGCSAENPVSVTVSTSPDPLPTINKTGSQNNIVCSNSTGLTYTTELAGNTEFTWQISSGGSITSGMGSNAVTVNWSIAGSQWISVNYKNASGCKAATANLYNVTVNPLPKGKFNYSNSPYCSNGSDPLPAMETGGQKGVFSSTSGVVFVSASTGQIDLSASTAGTYTITNTIAAGVGCAEVIESSSITISALPVATIVYSGTPFCTSVSTGQLVTLNGNGGTFSSAPGLSIDGNTGSIIPSTSTPGNYIVTYKISAAKGCAEVNATTPVNITKLPTVNISYSNTQFCKSDGQKSVTRTGDGVFTGGSYSAESGLTIDPTSGLITPSSSTAGTYTITYSTLASGGCAIVYANTSVTITAVPTATITYSGTPFCTTQNSELVTRNGTGAYSNGTYSSTVGLSINSTTSEINPSSSTPGSYTVKYEIPATGGCALVPVTTSVLVSPKPVVNAGTDVSTCANGGTVNITAEATASNILGNVTWSGGLGSWLNTNSQTAASYEPTASEISNGSVELTLSASGGNGCSSETSTDKKLLVINALPANVVILPDNVTLCVGGIQPLLSVKSTATNGSIAKNSGVLNLSIPDNSTLGSYSLININTIPANAVISSVSINFNITHPVNGDLTINLKAANGKVLNIANALTGPGFVNTTINSVSTNPIQTSGDTGPFSGIYGPQMRYGTQGATSVPGGSNRAFAKSFSELFGSPNGNWILSVRDGGLGDEGSFGSWSLTINYSVPVEPVPVTWLPITDLFTDAEATVPYIGDAVSVVYALAKSTGNKNYVATSTNANFCQVIKEVTLVVNPSPQVRIAADYCTNSGNGKITLTAISINPQSWNWSTGETTETVLVDIAHEYYVSVTNTSGCVGTGILSVAQELVTNGDFEQGNTGFSTEYTYVPSSPNPPPPGAGHNYGQGLTPEGSYAVDTSANPYHELFHGRDHTTSEQKGKFMMVNGSNTKIGTPAHLRVIWEQTVVVQPNTDYYFSAWAMNLNNAPFARLQFEVNGVKVGTIADLNVAPVPLEEFQVSINNWVRFYSDPKWKSEDATTAVIRIVNLNEGDGGNDFGLDDISFGTLSPFVSAPTEAGRDNQVVCVDNPILPITYKVGSGATGPDVDGLPSGFQSNFDGLNFTITGTPTTPGVYNYTVRTTGSCPNPSAATGTITVGANATLNLTSSGNTDRSLCVNSNLVNNIVFSITGGGTGASFSGLPPNMNYSFINGVATISGSSNTPGVYNYKIKTTGSCKQDSLVGVIKISAASKAGVVSAPTICLGESGDINLLPGSVGQILQWDVSNDGITYSPISNTTNTQPFSGISQSTFYRVLVKNEVCDAVYSLPATLKIKNLWEGRYSTAWSNPLNWSSGSLPSLSNCNGTITIGKGVNYEPVLTGTATVKDLNILSNGDLSITGGNLQVSGIITNSGILNARNGGVEYNGINPQNIPSGLFLNNAINELKISNTTASGLTLLGQTDIYRSVTFGSSGKNLNTNGYLTFKSTKDETASLGNMTGKTIIGDATVERFINTGKTVDGAHSKSWQLLAVPTIGQTIKQAWQEGATATNVGADVGSEGNPHPGYGTMITSNVSNAASQPNPGFDVYTSPGPSIKTYNSISGGYDGPSSTSDPIYNPKGFMTLVRGDRSVFTYNAPANPTVLRTKGKLFTPSNLPTPVSVTTGKMQSVGNPYASAIDIRNLSFGIGISSTIIVWDPTLTTGYGLGAFQTLYVSGSNYVNLLSSSAYGTFGTINNFIQSGQAFIIQPTGSGSGGTLVFKESDKANGSKMLLRETLGSRNKDPQIKVNLYNFVSGVPEVADGTLTQFGDNYLNKTDDADVRKMLNTSENLSIKSDNRNLVIERRLPVVSTDTLFYEIRNVRVQNYRLEFIATGLSDYNAEGWIEDTYLNTKTPLNPEGVTILNYRLENIPGSYKADRFRIIFKTGKTVLPVTFTGIKATQKDRDVVVEWIVENEGQMSNYEVESSLDGNSFGVIGSVKSNNSGTGTYSLKDNDVKSGYHYYRVKGKGLDGSMSYTSIVKVLVGEIGIPASISIYPNPIVNGVVNLQFINQVSGNYGIRLLNPLGQLILVKKLKLTGGNHNEKIDWDYKLAHGIYHLEVTKPDNGVLVIKVIY